MNSLHHLELHWSNYDIKFQLGSWVYLLGESMAPSSALVYDPL